MNFLKRILLLLISCQLFFYSFSQTDSCDLRISLLTCSPGDDLYSLFGHSALRVTDRSAGTDIIYNYGTFDFDDPDFYLKFARGKLLYYVSIEAYEDFIYAYQMEQRGIIEQVLQLNCVEKQNLYSALKINSLENNKYYHYEFLFDNCTTRLREMIANNADNLAFKNILDSPPLTFRDMLHSYLDQGQQYWSKLGIDLLLGNGIDRNPDNKEAMFLPDYLMKGFDSTVKNNAPFVTGKRILLPRIDPDTGQPLQPAPPAASTAPRDWLLHPLTATVLLLIFGIVITFMQAEWAIKLRYFLDVCFLMLLGGIGVLLFMMWFSTEHALCANNYNLLWAWPVHLPAAFFLYKKKKWMKSYFIITALFYLMLLITWTLIPQGMNAAFLPIVILAGIRSTHLAIKK